MTSTSLTQLSRRDVVKWMAAAMAGSAFMTVHDAFGLFNPSLLNAGRERIGVGYGSDPNLLKPYKPGDYWPLIMDSHQRELTAVLCDLIIPADEHGPSATSLKVDEFIDEWISAPYPIQRSDQKRILPGLAWLDAQGKQRFGKWFADLTAAHQTAILDDICFAPKAKPGFAGAANFFDLFRDLTALGYYTTPEGMKDIGYRGNVPLPKYDGPPQEVLKRLGL